MARHTPTTSYNSEAAKAASARIAATPLPSALELGRHLAAVEIAHDEHDAAQLSAPDMEAIEHDRAKDVLWRRGQALRDLIATIPPATLADVAVQINVGILVAEDLVENRHTPDEYAARGAILERMLCGMLPVVVKAAGLDLGTMNMAVTAGFGVSRYAGVGA